MIKALSDLTAKPMSLETDRHDYRYTTLSCLRPVPQQLIPKR